MVAPYIPNRMIAVGFADVVCHQMCHMSDIADVGAEITKTTLHVLQVATCARAVRLMEVAAHVRELRLRTTRAVANA